MDDRPSGGRKAPVDRTRRTGRLVRRPSQTWASGSAKDGSPRGARNSGEDRVHGSPRAVVRVGLQVAVVVQRPGAARVPLPGMDGLIDRRCRLVLVCPGPRRGPHGLPRLSWSRVAGILTARPINPGAAGSATGHHTDRPPWSGGTALCRLRSAGAWASGGLEVVAEVRQRGRRAAPQSPDLRHLSAGPSQARLPQRLLSRRR